MILFVNLCAVAAVFFGFGTLADHLGCNATLIGGMGFWGAVSFFLGPYATGSGFFARGFLVDTATPEWIWRTMGVVIWVAAAMTLLMTRHAHST